MLRLGAAPGGGALAGKLPVAPMGGALRYRQIGVIVRDLEPYHDLLASVFAAHGIPCFIDRRRSVSHHPLVELVRALLRLLVEDWPSTAAAAMLKSGLTPIPRNRADLVENYLLAHGIVGWATWCGGDWTYRRRMVGADEEPAEPDPLEERTLAKANYARRCVCDLLRDWANPASHQPQGGREWADRLYKTLERLKVAQRLARWGRAGRSAADALGQELHQQHVRAWGLLVQLLDDLVAGLGDEPLTAEQFQATIEAGLEAFSLPLIPPVVDQVVIGSVERSRQPEIAAAFVLGFNEGLFPHRPGQDVLLCDAEREQIGQVTESVDLPTGRQRLFDERMLAYIALTRASRYVWLSYAQADETGKEAASLAVPAGVGDGCAGTASTAAGGPAGVAGGGRRRHDVAGGDGGGAGGEGAGGREGRRREDRPRRLVEPAGVDG